MANFNSTWQQSTKLLYLLGTKTIIPNNMSHLTKNILHEEMLEICLLCRLRSPIWWYKGFVFTP
jgi:hypothetical protein